ncbi:conserved hypothetical protein, partial [Trichinella spiralis]|uniref:hypothetical protein n=1 Tax=Trichinella spiralis TaxID=6334 RepID=UPI0001EFDA8C
LVNEEDARNQQGGQLREEVSAYRFQRSHYILIANQQIKRPYLVLHTKTESVLSANSTFHRIPEQTPRPWLFRKLMHNKNKNNKRLLATIKRIRKHTHTLLRVQSIDQ